MEQNYMEVEMKEDMNEQILHVKLMQIYIYISFYRAKV